MFTDLFFKLSHVSRTKSFECIRELPNLHSSGHQKWFGSSRDTSQHLPTNSAFSCSSPRPAATPLYTSAAPLQSPAQGAPQVQRVPRPPPFCHTQATTHTLWATALRLPEPRRTPELRSDSSCFWQAGWSRTQGGTPAASPRTGAFVNDCEESAERQILYATT